MKVSELSQELVGKKVSCMSVEHRTGTITGLIAYDHKGIQCEFDDPEACSKGVVIKLDKPVYNHVGCKALGTECEWWQETLESTCPVMPQSFRKMILDKDGEECLKMIEAHLYSRTGNLGYTTLLEEGGKE